MKIKVVKATVPTTDAGKFDFTIAAVGFNNAGAGYGNAQGTGAPLAPGLATGMVDICDAASCPGTHAAVPTGSGAVNLVTVSISGYVHASIVTFVAPATLNFNDISVTMRENL